jgi:hypothetical protein
MFWVLVLSSDDEPPPFPPQVVYRLTGEGVRCEDVPVSKPDRYLLGDSATELEHLVAQRTVPLNVSEPEKVVAQMVRVARPGGVVAVQEPDHTFLLTPDLAGIRGDTRGWPAEFRIATQNDTGDRRLPTNDSRRRLARRARVFERESDNDLQ